MNGDDASAPWTPQEFEAAIRAVGAERYHDKHPFHKLLHGGKLAKGQLGLVSLLCRRVLFQVGYVGEFTLLLGGKGGGRTALRASYLRYLL